MRYFAGLDVSLDTTQICVVDPKGSIVLETQTETHPLAIAERLKATGWTFSRVGFEAQNTAEWLYFGLIKARLPAICIDALHASRILKNRLNKTDRNDARGIADLMRLGQFRAVHIKSPQARQMKTLIAARALLQSKAMDLENAIYGFVRGAGIKFPKTAAKAFEARARAVIGPSPVIALIEPLLAARRALREAFERADRALVAQVRQDRVCERLMTVPGVGPLTALTYRAVIDDPARFARSRSVAAHLGLTPATRQSGRMSRRGRITRSGDGDLRRALFNAARAVMSPRTGANPLRRWAQAIGERRGKLKAIIALARRLAVLLHRLWVDETEFRPEASAA